MMCKFRSFGGALPCFSNMVSRTVREAICSPCFEVKCLYDFWNECEWLDKSWTITRSGCSQQLLSEPDWSTGILALNSWSSASSSSIAPFWSSFEGKEDLLFFFCNSKTRRVFLTYTTLMKPLILFNFIGFADTCKHFSTCTFFFSTL